MLTVAQQLAAANIPFRVMNYDDPKPTFAGKPYKVVITENPADVPVPAGTVKIAASNPGWLTKVKALDVTPVSIIEGPSTIRTIVRQKGDATIVHVLNLNMRRLSSFEDKVTPATNLKLRIRYRARASTTIKAFSADANATHETIPFNPGVKGDVNYVDLTLPRVDVSTLLIVQ
jgi:hypothetical protein